MRTAEQHINRGGTTTDCPLIGVHGHAFRGPHRFHEWEPGAAAQADTAPGGGLRERIAGIVESHGGPPHLVDELLAKPPDPADLARWLQDTIEQQPAITIRSGVEPQVAWRALADELLRRWGR